MATALIIVDSAKAQQTKPEFKKFTLVSYRPSGKGDKKFIRIEDCIYIDGEGIMRKTYNIFEDYYGDLSFKGFMGDTTYRLPDSLIVMMNKVFADSKALGEPNRTAEAITSWSELRRPLHLHFLY